MNSRRFEHDGKNRFWEVFWERNDAEAVSGIIGTNGRARQISISEIESEIASKLKQGFREVLPEFVQAQRAQHVGNSPEWLARIAEEFDDDAPRRIYADWLQTQGDPLGEFIAIQCERARLDPWDPACKPLREREDNLLATFRARWLPGVTGVEVVFHRGFPERVRVAEPIDRAMLKRVAELAPLLRTLEVAVKWSPGTALILGLFHAADLDHVTGLFLRGVRLSGTEINDLVAARELAAIDRLGLRGANATGRTLKPLATRSWSELDLHQNALGANGVAHALASAAHLTALDVGSSGIGDDGALLLTEVPLPKLVRLSLRRSGLTARSLAPLARARGLAALRFLDLSANQLARADAAALFDAPALPSLVALDLRESAFDDDAAIALSRSPLAAQLASLDLGQNLQLGEAGVRALAETGMPALRHLHVTGIAAGAMQLLKAALPHTRVVARPRRTTA